MGPEEVEVAHANTQALSLYWSQFGEQKLGRHNLAEKKERTGGSEKRH